MAQVGFGSRGVPREKWCVARHRTMPASEADRCERSIERQERQAGKAECEAGLAEYEDRS